MKHSHFYGVGLLFISHLFFTSNFTIVKYLTDVYTIPQLMFFRFMLGPLLILPLLFYKDFSFNLSRLNLLSLRSVAGIAAMGCLYLGFKYGEAGQTTLFFHLSVIWTFLISRYLFKEKPHRFSLWAIPFAFLGLFLILSPIETTLTKGTLFAALGSLFHAIVILSLKSLRKTHDPMTIVIFFNLAALILLAKPADLTLPLFTSNTLYLIGLVSVLSFGGQWCLTSGYKYCLASIGSAIGLVQVPIMYLVGLLVFSEILSMLNVMGVLFVFCAILVITIYQ